MNRKTLNAYVCARVLSNDKRLARGLPQRALQLTHDAHHARFTRTGDRAIAAPRNRRCPRLPVLPPPRG